MATTTQFLSGLAVGVLLSLLLLTLPYLLPSAIAPSSTNLHSSLLTTLIHSPYLSVLLLLPTLALLLTLQYHLYTPYTLSLTLPATTKTRHSKRNLSTLPPPVPSAYYRLLASSALTPATTTAATLCQSHDLVVYRPERGSTVDSKAVVLDAYCPHLGAHLAYGGKVSGDSIDCPFHGWRFNREGKCTLIPYAGKVPDVARTGVWTVEEVDDSVLVWYDADSEQPSDTKPGSRVRSVMTGSGSGIGSGGGGGSGGRCVGWLSMEVGGHVREVMESFIDRSTFESPHLYSLITLRWQRTSQWREATDNSNEGRIDIQLSITALNRQLHTIPAELHVLSPVYACLLLKSHKSAAPSHFLFLSLLPSAAFVHTLTAALYVGGGSSGLLGWVWRPVSVMLARVFLLHPLLSVVQQLMAMVSAKGDGATTGGGTRGSSDGGERLDSSVDGALLAYRRWYDRFCSAKGTKRRDGVDW